MLDSWQNHNDNDCIERCNLRFFFYNLLSAPQTVSSTYTQVARVQLCGNHMLIIGRSSRATCVPHHTKGQISSAQPVSAIIIIIFIKLDTLNHIYFSFILLAVMINQVAMWLPMFRSLVWLSQDSWEEFQDLLHPMPLYMLCKYIQRERERDIYRYVCSVSVCVCVCLPVNCVCVRARALMHAHVRVEG